jgi:hypothetical protein
MQGKGVGWGSAVCAGKYINTPPKNCWRGGGLFGRLSAKMS